MHLNYHFWTTKPPDVFRISIFKNNLFEESLYPQKWIFSVNPMLLPTVRDGRFVDDEIPQEMRNIQYDLSPERMEKVWVCKNYLDHLCQGSRLFFTEFGSRSSMNLIQKTIPLQLIKNFRNQAHTFIFPESRCTDAKCIQIFSYLDPQDWLQYLHRNVLYGNNGLQICKLVTRLSFMVSCASNVN
jgi:hypothetical protein